MRLTPIVLIGAALVLTQMAPDAEAQRQGRIVQPQRQATNSGRFRARPAIERLVTARRLLGLNITISDAYLNSPFSLTPRQTNATGRGWLTAQNVQQLWTRVPQQSAGQPWAGEDGVLQFADSTYGNAQIHLENAAGKRFLVDCSVFGPGTIRAHTQAAETQVNAANGALLSVVTAPGEDVVTITGQTVPNPWRLLGCEITRVQ